MDTLSAKSARYVQYMVHKYVYGSSNEETYMYTLAQKASYMAQLWRAKVRLIETTIYKKADFGNYSFVQLGLRERLIGNL